MIKFHYFRGKSPNKLALNYSEVAFYLRELQNGLDRQSSWVVYEMEKFIVKN
jgi:hypothetical protein